MRALGTAGLWGRVCACVQSVSIHGRRFLKLRQFPTYQCCTQAPAFAVPAVSSGRARRVGPRASRDGRGTRGARGRMRAVPGPAVVVDGLRYLGTKAGSPCRCGWTNRTVIVIRTQGSGSGRESGAEVCRCAWCCS